MSLTTIQNHIPVPDRDGGIVQPPRQIRFVSTDGQPHTKRRRINAACLTCRKRKTRCSGERPICQTCTENGHSCLGYAESAQHQRENSTADSAVSKDGDAPRRSPSVRPPTSSHRGHSSSPSPGDSRPRIRHHASIDSHQSARSDRTGQSPPTFIPGSEPRSPASNLTSLSIGTRNRVPFFRYFGPTAIVPGFKQMVVQMKESRPGPRSVSADSATSGMGPGGRNHLTPPPNTSEPKIAPPIDIPFYDTTSPLPISPLIMLLCQTFFTHLGCNYPFLQRERFLHDLAEKKVDAILVDAVCALGARFSTHPLVSTPSDHSVEIDENNETGKAFRGNAFAQRAMSAVIDTLPCPRMAVVQACLLLAYGEFGLNHDSGLWQWLGLAIRMAQDLGMQKLEGLKLEGRVGPTPKTAKSGADGLKEEASREQHQKRILQTYLETQHQENVTERTSMEDRKASERERIDTFYAIFFLDRVVSSGTGRPVTLRDKEIEISFPYRSDDEDSVDGWPHPFPPLIRIVHLYGRIADVLNGIREASHVTPDTLKKLAGMEKDLTGIYQGLSPKLHFNAVNFQHYVKNQQGTNFILLHFWFHTLICIVHQPSLLRSFEGRIHHLFPDSRELSMSSAKTIADILAFAELIDVKSFIGNPFTSQPMYIAACAFLKEAEAQSSAPPSRAISPVSPVMKTQRAHTFPEPSKLANIDPKLSSKHTLLATAANQNYQRCYKALKSLEGYWAGARYIVTVLDQKAKGIMDPLLYTSEDVDGAVELPKPEPAFTSPGWRRSIPVVGAPFGAGFQKFRPMGPEGNDWSSKIDPSQAIGWSLTGTTNSPNPNLSFLYQSMNGGDSGVAMSPPNLPDHADAASFIFEPPMSNMKVPEVQTSTPTSHFSAHIPAPQPPTSSAMPPPSARPSPIPGDHNSNSDADLLLGLHHTYPQNAPTRQSPNNLQAYANAQAAPSSEPNNLNYSQPQTSIPKYAAQPPPSQHYPNVVPGPMNDMAMIESQDIDFNAPQGGLTFSGGDMVPWLEYLPPDVLNYFGDPQHDSSIMSQAGPGPPPHSHQPPA